MNDTIEIPKAAEAYTLAEVTVMLQQSRQTILNWITHGRIAARKINGCWFIDAAEIKRLTMAGAFSFK